MPNKFLEVVFTLIVFVNTDGACEGGFAVIQTSSGFVAFTGGWDFKVLTFFLLFSSSFGNYGPTKLYFEGRRNLSLTKSLREEFISKCYFGKDPVFVYKLTSDHQYSVCSPSLSLSPRRNFFLLFYLSKSNKIIMSTLLNGLVVQALGPILKISIRFLSGFILHKLAMSMYAQIL